MCVASAPPGKYRAFTARQNSKQRPFSLQQLKANEGEADHANVLNAISFAHIGQNRNLKYLIRLRQNYQRLSEFRFRRNGVLGILQSE